MLLSSLLLPRASPAAAAAAARSLQRRVRFIQTLVEFKNANVHRFGQNELAMRDLTFSIDRNQRLVIVGPVSAGKTTLAEALAGKHLIQPLSAARWPVVDNTRSPYISDHVHLVSFKEDSNLFSYSSHYYQERFNFSDPDNDLTLESYLAASQQSSPESIAKVAEQLDIRHLLHLSFVKLSNGQTRRARIARALLRDPSMLILDEPLMGLDVQHRERLLDILGNMATRIPVVLVLRPQDELPSWATDVVSLEKMKIAWQGSPEEYQVRRERERQQKEKKSGKPIVKEHPPGDPVVQLEKVNVVYSGQKILDNISWTVRQGERWALLGPNGSGKTTLLSFLTGDHPQAYANELYLFGRRRGTGESIWDIKEKVGLVSPEVHLYFNQALTGLEAVGTGFFDVVVPRKLSDTQVETVNRMFKEFGMESFASRRLRDMSTGEQRMVLLIRSLVKMPQLIIWDEPFQGLDADMIEKVNNWLECHMRPDQSLILVTHHEEEIPRAVTKRFKLGPGGVDAN